MNRSNALSEEEFKKRLNNYTNNTVELLTPYVNRHQKVKIKCKICGYEWEISPSCLSLNSMKKHTFRGCPECKWQEVECAYCHKKFKRLKSELSKHNKTGNVYCSKECSNKHKNEQFTNWNDGLDYRRNAFNFYEHKCAICGYDEDERILEVHHIDENRKNNRVENLMILCPICHKKLTLHLYSFDELIKKYKL